MIHDIRNVPTHVLRDAAVHWRYHNTRKVLGFRIPATVPLSIYDRIDEMVAEITRLRSEVSSSTPG